MKTTPSHNWTRYLLALFILIIGIILSFWAFQNTKKYEKEQMINSFKKDLETQQAGIRRNLDLTLKSLTAARANLGASQVINAKDFKTQVEELIKSSGINFASWVPRVFYTDKAIHELSMKRQGFENYQINIEGIATEETLFPISYVETMQKDFDGEKIQGLNLASEIFWKESMNKARDTGSLLVTKPLMTTNKNHILGLIIPVYLYGLPNDIGPRRINLRGFIFANLELEDIVNKALSQELAQYIEIKLQPATATIAETNTLQFNTTLTIADSEWLLSLIPKPEFYQQSQSLQSIFILAGGLVFTILMVVYLFMLMGRTIEIERLVNERTQALKQAHQELQESQTQMIHAEKMSTLGQTVAGVVHEINTPVAFVKSSINITKTTLLPRVLEIFAEYETILQQPNLQQQLTEENKAILKEINKDIHGEKLLEEVKDLLDNGMEGLEIITDLVITLKDFSRLDKAEMAPHNINEGLENALKMIHHMLKDKITINKKFGDLPPIICSSSQINQVLLNLLVNAIHAIESKEKGMISLITQKINEEYIQITITDTGKGISPENLEKIFQPFFTTKGSGKGTGLGLAIAYRIIQDHQGSITAKSEIGVGTSFIINLPIKQNHSKS